MNLRACIRTLLDRKPTEEEQSAALRALYSGGLEGLSKRQRRIIDMLEEPEEGLRPN